jgi:hypothetical protein
MTVSENAGDLILTEVFEYYSRYAGFSIRLCRGYDPQSKGKIEAVVKYVKNDFLTCREYPGISRLNSDGLARPRKNRERDGSPAGKKHETAYMIPNRVFPEEIRHLKPVPELSQPDLPKTANIRKANVIHCKRNRYEVPKGSYLPGRQALVETEEDKVKFFVPKTGELLAEHTIYEGFGKLISLPRNTQRFKNDKWEELKTAVLSGFDDSEQANIFISEIVKKYPRTIRD